MLNRLNHLESLVKGSMASQPSDDIDPRAKSQNHVSGRVVDATYVGATHWAAMLDDIEEVKGYFSEHGDETTPGDESVRPDISLLLNSNNATTTTSEDLLAALPERNIVNRLVSRYFSSNSPALHIIHKTTFQKNYRKFWDDPRGSPISFLALIYSIMCLGTFAALGADEENANAGSTPTGMIQVYRGFCAQCLGLSNYARHPGPYTLETFLLYIECEFLLSKGDQMNCYLIVGVAVRLALRIGLHRDSDMVEGNIIPYQAEMRRRVWHLLVQMDLLVSFHNGLPSMVQAVKSDTRVPLNLHDQDFDECSTELPPSRPETEITVMSYPLAKGRLAHVFGKIVEQANLLTLPDYAEVTALDGELQQAFSAIPPFLRVVPMDLCITDSAELIIRRLSLAVLFQKSRCILHRKYLMKEKENAEFSYSKEVAIDASRELLRMQSEVHEAAQPGGMLCKDSLYSIFQSQSIEAGFYTRVDDAPGYDARESLSRLSLSGSATLPDLFGGGQHEGFGNAIPFPSPTTHSNIDFESIPIGSIGEITDMTMDDFDWDVFDNHIRQSHATNENETYPDISFQNSSFEENAYNL
ncbi:putative transcriptional regulatory protein C139,03 [Talaromyces islandicus]|uniref:Putative transcriptional regulatory protein C139,03 n=1 Tax=Talaromyces islandicus TaxID=28573 RepID=A0A0U1LLP6_TALIS|nr:putative transcriptional regulatory protein C139,03 [Talaromyces islandicus]